MSRTFRGMKTIPKEIFEDDRIKKLNFYHCEILNNYKIHRFPKDLEELVINDYGSPGSNNWIVDIMNLPRSLTKLELGSGDKIDLGWIDLPTELIELEISCYIDNEIELPIFPYSVEVLKLECLGFERFSRAFPKNLRYIDLSNCAITSIPKGLPDGLKVFKANSTGFDDYHHTKWNDGIKTVLADDLPRGLEELYLSYNEIESIVGSFPENLQILHLNDTHLNEDDFHLPENLTELNISNNRFSPRILELLPQKIKKLTLFGGVCSPTSAEYNLPRDLEHLLISSRYGTLPDKLPEGIKSIDLRSRSELRYLAKRLPSYIPEGIEIIEIGYCEIEELPENLPDSLQKLFIVHSEIDYIPDKLSMNLRDLKLIGSNIKVIPETLPDGLINLILSYAQIEAIPDNLPNSLKKINLSENSITSIPENLPNGLKDINLNGNSITSIPDNLPKSLSILQLSINPITIFPDNLPENLSTLCLHGTSIKSLSNISHSKLKHINLSTSKIEEVVNCEFDNVRTIHLSTNPLRKFENVYLPCGILNLGSLAKEIKDTFLKWTSYNNNKKINIATMEAKIAKHTRRDLHYYADFIKGHFEFWSLREEGLRFHQAHQEFQDFLTN